MIVEPQQAYIMKGLTLLSLGSNQKKFPEIIHCFVQFLFILSSLSKGNDWVTNWHKRQADLVPPQVILY